MTKFNLLLVGCRSGNQNIDAGFCITSLNVTYIPSTDTWFCFYCCQ